jgi:hypothetical protein
MDRKERLKMAYDYLYNKGIIHEQKDLAAIMKASKSNISSALAGKESVLTNNFIRRFCEAFKGTFNLDWLLNGEGEMLNQTVQAEKPSTLEAKIDELLKSNAELIAMLKDEQELNKRLVISIANEMADMKVALRQLASGQPVQHYSLERDDVNPAAMNDPLKNLK